MQHCFEFGEGRYNLVSFPQDTGGFLYYRRPPPGAHDLAGCVRFRVTNDPDPASFARGHDLLVRGVPWGRALLPLAGTVRAFTACLYSAGLLSVTQVARLAGFLPAKRARSHVVHAYRQLFVLDIVPASINRTRAVAVLGSENGRDRLGSIRLATHRGIWAYGTRAGGYATFTQHGTYPTRHSHDCKAFSAGSLYRLLQ
jgi:hypothetical protein